MARISGIDLPRDKRIEVALTYIYGIGPARAAKVLEMTQIGKECHSHCEIYKRMGECIMPREGVFAIVLHGGTIRKGDLLERIE